MVKSPPTIISALLRLTEPRAEDGNFEALVAFVVFAPRRQIGNWKLEIVNFISFVVQAVVLQAVILVFQRNLEK